MIKKSIILMVLMVLFLEINYSQTNNYFQILKEATAKSTEKKWDEATALWEKVTQLNPTVGRNWVEYANALYEAKQYRKAITAYEKFNELGASFPADGVYSMAGCYALLGEKEKALELLEKAINLGYRDLKQTQEDTDFESLRNNKKYRELVGLVDTSKMSRDEGWRYDLSFLAREIKRLHYNPYHTITPAEFEAFVKKLNDDIPKLNDQQIIVGMLKLMRLSGDGHTTLRKIPLSNGKSLPVQFYLFEEGLFIIAATPEQKDLLGAKVLKIGENSVEKTIEILDSIISQDNKMWVKSVAPNYMRIPLALNGLGLIPDINKVSLTVLDTQGKTRVVSLEGNSDRPTPQWATVRDGQTTPEPLYLKNRNARYWFEYLPAQKMVYFQYNAVLNDQKEPLPVFCERLFKFINENEVESLVIDMRWNSGGNLFFNKPLIHGLISNQKINQKGKLFVITGRQTFSAAMNGVAQINKHTNAMFVGEPTGSSPNFIGEVIPVTLPYSKMEGSISDLFWQGTFATDHRTWIAPEIYAPPTFELYKANRDPAMEAILNYSSVK